MATCLLLTRRPLPPSCPAGQVYNTPADMMSFLVDPSNAVFFDTATRIHIALCVKLDGVSPCDGSTTSKNYLSLFSEVIANATAVSEQVGGFL